MSTELEISVIICSRNRASLLGQTLRGLQNQWMTRVRCELIVVDNGSSDGTPEVLRQRWARIEMCALHEPIAGKSRALNRAMDSARGHTLLFTDDDVVFSPGWMEEFYRAFNNYRSSSLFCGPISPLFPEGVPDWLRSHPYGAELFGRFEPGVPTGILPKSLTPFGANFAVRASAAVGERFRLDLGPSLENGPLFGEDTEFVRRFIDREGHSVYVANARVFHPISPIQVGLPWILERAFHLGRACAVHGNELQLIHSGSQFLQSGSESDPRYLYEKASILNFYCGQLCQFVKTGSEKLQKDCRKTLLDLDAMSSQHLFGDSARKTFAPGFPLKG